MEICSPDNTEVVVIAMVRVSWNNPRHQDFAQQRRDVPSKDSVPPYRDSGKIAYHMRGLGALMGLIGG
jgi:hypothetical protein